MDTPGAPSRPDNLNPEPFHCEFCGYNMHGLAADATCPECGVPVGGSIQPDALRLGDPEWLEKLRWSMSLKIWNLGLTIIAGMAAGILVTALAMPPIVMTLVQLAGGTLGLWAVFLLTSAEPRIALEEDPITLRKVVRAAALLSFAGMLVAQLLGRYRAALIIASSLSLAGLVQFFGEFVYLRRFALRVPAIKLARSTHIAMWGTIITHGVLVISGWVVLLQFGFTAATLVTGGPTATPGAAAAGAAAAPAAPPLGALRPLAAPMCAASLAAVVFLFWYIRLLYAYRVLFAAARDQARELAQDRPPATG
jgi:hypothetical protein